MAGNVNLTQSAIHTLEQNWEEACQCLASKDKMDHPVTTVACGHLFDRESAVSMWGTTKLQLTGLPEAEHPDKFVCPGCRQIVVTYIESPAVSKIAEQGRSLLQDIQLVFNENQAMRQGRPISQRQGAGNGHLQPLPEPKPITHPVIAYPGGEEIFEASVAPEKKGVQYLNCIGARGLLDQRDALIKLRNQLIIENKNLKLEDSKSLAGRVQDKSAARVVPNWRDYNRYVYPGDPSHLKWTRRWAALDTVPATVTELSEAEKDPHVARRAACKDVSDSKTIILDYVRYLGLKSNNLEIWLGSTKKDVFSTYLKDNFGWELDEEENNRPGRTSKLAIFIARTPQQLAFALWFIKQNRVDEDEVKWLEQLVANYSDWTVAEEENPEFAKSSSRRYFEERASEVASLRAIAAMDPTQFETKRHMPEVERKGNERRRLDQQFAPPPSQSYLHQPLVRTARLQAVDGWEEYRVLRDRFCSPRPESVLIAVIGLLTAYYFGRQSR